MTNLIKKASQTFALQAFICLALTSCIKAELPNIEVDITNITSNSKGFIKANISENSATVFVDTTKTKLNNLSLNLEISEGATISPNPTSVTDYTAPQYFTLTSENEEWIKTWEINAQAVSENFPTKYDFNNWFTPDKAVYRHPYEIVDGTNLYIWASPNISMSIVLKAMYGDALNYSHFGACPSDKSVEGLALKLETIDIHTIAPTQPYVSGSLFVGEFESTNSDPLKATHFGTPFNKRPVSFKGSYNYIPNIIASSGATDTGLIEAVLYKVTEDTPYLNGYTIRDKSYKDIVAYAELDPNANSGGYKSFDIPFTYTQEVSDEDLKDWKYGLAVYFASSKAGDEYIGAGGTQLYIDNIEIVCE